MEEFDEIRPFRDDEVSKVTGELVSDPELLDFLAAYESPRLARVLPGIMRMLAKRRVAKLLAPVVDIKSFQKQIAVFVRKLIKETMTSFTYEGLQNLSKGNAYVFVSNHRDIACDSMLVDYALHESGFDTVRIAVGDNLVQREFVTSLMKLNKSFFIKRSVTGVKKIYASLMLSSRFIHQSLAEGESVWIAQAEGRAKDALDETDDAVIKMLALAERKRPFPDVVRGLCIVPVSISYELDPCAAIKARELYSIAENGSYTKSNGEDMLSLATGLTGRKGQVHVDFGEPLLDCYEDADEVAKALDREILTRLRVYPINILALRELKDHPDFIEIWQVLSSNETVTKIFDSDSHFSIEANFRAQLNECPEALREQWLMIYANPVANKVSHGLKIVLTEPSS